MTKIDIVFKISEQCNLSREKSKESLESILETIKETLKKGEEVTLRKFGRFRILNKAAREGRNPKSGKPAYISPRKVVSFKKGKFLMNIINEINR